MKLSRYSIFHFLDPTAYTDGNHPDITEFDKSCLGYNAIPEKYLTDIELWDVLLSVADDLGGFTSSKQK